MAGVAICKSPGCEFVREELRVRGNLKSTEVGGTATRLGRGPAYHTFPEQGRPLCPPPHFIWGLD